MPKTKKCPALLEGGNTATCIGEFKMCPKNRLQCRVSAACWKVPVVVNTVNS